MSRIEHIDNTDLKRVAEGLINECTMLVSQLLSECQIELFDRAKNLYEEIDTCIIETQAITNVDNLSDATKKRRQKRIDSLNSSKRALQDAYKQMIQFCGEAQGKYEIYYKNTRIYFEQIRVI